MSAHRQVEQCAICYHYEEVGRRVVMVHGKGICEHCAEELTVAMGLSVGESTGESK